VGLIDGPFCRSHADIRNADIEIRSFSEAAGMKKTAPESLESEHTTHSVALLCGSGKETIAGLMPRATLLVAIAIGSDKRASPGSLATAIHWLCDNRVEVIAVPLGCEQQETEVATALWRALDCKIAIYAAAGNVHPDPVLFPASHPAAISVGAINRRGELLPDSARRPSLDAVAPGHLICAPVSRHRTREMSGTSVATIVATAAHFLGPR